MGEARPRFRRDMHFMSSAAGAATHDDGSVHERRVESEPLALLDSRDPALEKYSGGERKDGPGTTSDCAPISRRCRKR